MSERAKKILWVFSSFDSGAAQRRFAALISRLGDDWEHVVCALDGARGAEALIEPNANWRPLEIGRKRGEGFSLAGLWSSRKILSEQRPDLLATAGLGAVEWLAVNRGPGGAPHVHFQDPVGPEEALEGADGRGDWARRRAFVGRNRAFVVEGGDEAEALLRRWGAAPESVKRLPWGVDLDQVRPVERRSNRVVIGSLAPLVAEKRHDRLVRILATLRERERNVALRLVGTGPERARLEAQAESLGLGDRVIFVDRDGLDPEVAAEETARMDIFADVSGVSRSRAAPALALSAGLPFLAADAGAAAAVAADANRVFIRPTEDESALAAAAELLVSDAELRRRIGAENRAAAMAAYDLDHMVSACAALFDEIAGAPNRLMLPAPGVQAPKPPQPANLKILPLPRRAPKPTPPIATPPLAAAPEPKAPSTVEPVEGGTGAPEPVESSKPAELDAAQPEEKPTRRDDETAEISEAAVAVGAAIAGGSAAGAEAAAAFQNGAHAPDAADAHKDVVAEAAETLDEIAAAGPQPIGAAPVRANAPSARTRLTPSALTPSTLRPSTLEPSDLKPTPIASVLGAAKPLPNGRADQEESEIQTDLR